MKSYFKISFFILLIVLPVLGWGQTTIFTETMGTATGTTTIAAHETANGFDNDGYTMTAGGATNPGDIRITTPSSGYTGASGGANIWLTTTNAQYGFGIEGIDASTYTSLSLSYGYYKNSATAHATFQVDYWNGTAWVNIANTAAALFNEASNVATGWYAAKTLSLPAGAQINGLKIRFTKTGTNGIRIDDVKLSGTAPACTPPSTQATAITFSSVGTTTMTVGWTRGSTPGDAVLAVGRAGSAATDPANGTPYTGNTTFGSGTACGGGSTVFSAAGTSVSVTSLAAETQYFFNAYEYTTATNCFKTPALSASRYTLSTEPTAQPASGLSATTCTANSIDLTIPAPSTGADGYIVLQKTGSAPTGLPADANAYSVGNSIGDATVAAIVTAAGTITISGLSASTNYYFQLVPYNSNSALTAQTYNYLTSGTLLQTNFTTLAVGTSTASTVETDATYVYSQNIAYNTYQSVPVPISAAGSVGVHNIIIKDGGSTTDADALPTILTAISYTYTGTANTIRAAALFTTTGSKVAEGTVGANSISFSGLSGANVTAADNSVTELILRVTFTTTVTDNDKLVFTVSSVTGGNLCSYSQFAAANGGGAVSDNISGNDKNRIEVTADRIRFTTQPADQAVNTNLATFVVTAQDVNSNTDLDATNSFTLTTSGSGMTAVNPYAMVNGVCSISNVQFNAAQGPITLTATTTGLSFDNDDVSSSFSITNVASGSYRTTSSGTWSTATWERFSSGWASSSAPTAGNTTDMIYIRHAVSFVGSVSFGKITIESGGTLSNTSSCSISNTLLVKTGGTLQVNASLSLGGTFEVEDGGDVNINFAFGTPSTSIWGGTENFHPNSNLTLQDWDGANDILIPDNTAISTNTYSGYTAAFGNIILDFGANLGSSDDMIFLASGITINMAHGSLIFRSNSTVGADMRLSTTGTVTSGIGGDFIVEDTYTNTQYINIKTSGTLTFSINGNMQLDAATTRLFTSSTAGSSCTINVDGDINITPSAVLEFNPTVAGGSPAPLSILNVKGDVTIASSGLLQNTNSSSPGQFNFTGTGDGLTSATTQTIDIASTSANENRYIAFSVNSGAYVQLINRNFELGTNSGLTVKNGGVLDFGFATSTPLILGISGSMTGTKFVLEEGGTLKITSADGVNYANAIGNVQVDNRTFDQVATFHYIGKTNQVTGSGILVGSSAKIIICDLIDNNTQLTFTNSTGITSATTISATGGKLDIRKGQVIETATQYITGSTGTLYMSAGTLYRIVCNSSSGSDVIPRLDGANFSYNLAGGTIDLNGTAGTQYLRGARDYYSLMFSNGGTKYVSSGVSNIGDNSTINVGLVTIKDNNTILDVENNTFSGNAALTMTDSTLFRMSLLNNSLPQLEGAYTLAGGTIEWYGTTATQTHSIRGTDGSLNNITYNNIELNAAGTNVGADAANIVAGASFGVKGTMNVNSPACFKIGANYKISGIGNFILNANATLKYGNAYGITTSSTDAITGGNIINSGTRTLPATASYGFCGSVDQVSGSGLPATVVNLYVDKTSATSRITLTNSVRADNLLKMYSGNILTGTNLVELGVSTASLGTLDYTSGYIVGNMRRWYANAANSGIASGLFPLGQDVSGIIKNRFYNIEYVLGATTGGYLDVNFNPVPMGADGIPINGIPAVGTCATFNVVFTTHQGYWVATPETGNLTNGFYTLAITGEDFNNVSNICQLTLLKRVGTGNWLAEGTHLQPTGTGSMPTVSRSGLSGFSNFGFGGGTENPLPIGLKSFTAECIPNGVEIKWSTSSETNNDYFTLEKSLDAKHWVEVTSIKGAGNSNQILNYQYTDKKSFQAETYYKLKQTDNNGKTEEFSLVAVNCSGPASDVFVYPNPFTETLNIQIGQLDENIKITIYDQLGVTMKEILMDNITNDSGTVNLNLSSLSKGIYFVKIISGSYNKTEKIVKE